ncbi:uncharacterized protein MELLADRAFT_112431 [Melampsora larici-populina 98AG31]|uniref:AB hydrolase-1 domain-containing protein n=1 Tax=Melampsora larici-populina (strain 98AG31 / pathotype 3-4-7) TaxID=747676 RepID=F4S6G4_MELLP|nr:uncharacterized protein MELLADRAFT_112431 [Melampsora larici-populina 98AG31]EGF99765.1 hypothetical protein MELLADRAFT_112431 [Melampsora larici-populina 98AG31]
MDWIGKVENQMKQNKPNSEEIPTILDPKTRLQEGRCEVGNPQRLKSYKIYYKLQGTSSIQAKNKMIFLMGLNNTFFSWSKQVEHFGKLDDHVVLVFDNRGVGNSNFGPERFFKTSGMTKDVIDLLDFIGWNQSRSIDVIGVLMGGMIAQELCLLIPQRIVSVVFTSTQAGESTRLPPLSTTFGILQMLLSGGTPEDRIARLVTKRFPAVWLNSTASHGSGKTNREIKQEDSWLTCKILAPGKLVVLSGALDQVIDDGGHALCSQVPERHDALFECVMREGFEAVSSSS